MSGKSGFHDAAKRCVDRTVKVIDKHLKLKKRVPLNHTQHLRIDLFEAGSKLLAYGIARGEQMALQRNRNLERLLTLTIQLDEARTKPRDEKAIVRLTREIVVKGRRIMALKVMDHLGEPEE